MDNVIAKFLEKVKAIKDSNPKRREPGDGSDGYCDCIGLVIGAVRRMGLKWTGIHGSNWAARKEFVKLEKINSVSDLQVGDVVLKACDQSTKGWALPARYRKGGKYYNGDLLDYYHAGVVTQVNPLNITHMSSKMMVDTKLGKWSHHGLLTVLKKAGARPDDPSPAPAPTPGPSTGDQAYVVAESGGTVNMRRTPSLKGALIMRIPLMTIVNVIEPGEEWCKINYQNKTGYMMSKFLDIIGDGKGKY